jgi:heme exporter protein B
MNVPPDVPVATTLGNVLVRECLIAARKPGQWLQPLVFFLMVITLFPLAINPDPTWLRMMAPAIVWAAVLLSSTLALDGLFRADYEDGLLEQWALSGQPLWALCLVKVFVHWLFSGFMLTLIAPLAALMLFVPMSAMGTLFLSLILGSLTLSLWGSLSAAITLSARRSSTLMSLLILPLAMPLLIFGAKALDLVIHSEDPQAALWLLASLAVLSITLTPAALAAAIRIALE